MTNEKVHLRRWRSLSCVVRRKIFVGKMVQCQAFNGIFEIKEQEPDDQIFGRWFNYYSDEISLKIQRRSRHFVVTLEDLFLSCRLGIEDIGISHVSSAEEAMVLYIRAADPLNFKDKNVCELGSGVRRF